WRRPSSRSPCSRPQASARRNAGRTRPCRSPKTRYVAALMSHSGACRPPQADPGGATLRKTQGLHPLGLGATTPLPRRGGKGRARKSIIREEVPGSAEVHGVMPLLSPPGFTVLPDRAVHFTFRGPDARDVRLAGTFTGWTEDPLVLARNGNGLWEAQSRPLAE